MSIPRMLWEAVKLRAAALGYTGPVAYIIGLIRFDLLSQHPHDITLHFSKLPLDMQDQVDEGLLEVTKSGEGQRGSFFRKTLDEVAKEHQTQLPADKAAAGVVEKLAQFRRSKKDGGTL